jgi:hypothetical protein
MSISQTKYIRITSTVAAATQAAVRSLMGRIYTTSPYVDPNSVLVFNQSQTDNIEALFGEGSEEYNRAVQYFNYVSQSATAPQQLSFARYSSGAAAPAIYGKAAIYALAALQAVTAGSLIINSDGVQQTVAGISFAADESLAAVAATLQTAINTVAGDPNLTTATVTYNAVNQWFAITGGTTGDHTIVAIAPESPTATDVGTLLGLYEALGANDVGGTAGGSALSFVQAASQFSDNYGSYCFTFGAGLVLADHQAIAPWNQSQNVKYQYNINVTPTNAATWAAALNTFGGTGLTLASPGAAATTEFPELLPMSILAAVDYTQRNAAPGYMYKQISGLTASVTDDTDAATYDALFINYYGQTEDAGTPLAFYQNGVLQGGATDPLDQNTYGNEQWFKSAVAAAFLNAQLSLPQIPANNAGRAKCINIIKPQITNALFNGTIEPGKTLDTDDILYINQLTGDPKAWLQVQKAGWWLNVVIAPITSNGRTQYKAQYVLVYSKDDTVRSVIGQHILI